MYTYGEHRCSENLKGQKMNFKKGNTLRRLGYVKGYFIDDK